MVDKIDNGKEIFKIQLKAKDPDIKGIINIIKETNNEERQIIRDKYKAETKVPIQNDIMNSKLSYSLKDILICLFDTCYEYDAREIYKAIHSFVNDEDSLIEIIATRPKEHFDQVNIAYKKFFGIYLMDDLKKELSGDFKNFIISIIDTMRPSEQKIDPEEAVQIAKKINKIGIAKFGKDLNLFQELFLKNSREDLILISRAYFVENKISLYKDIKKNMSGNIKKLCMDLLFGLVIPAEYFSKKIWKSIQGLGTNENTLIRCIINRAEIDMPLIKEYYKYYRKVELVEDIKGDTSGFIQEILVNLIDK